MAPLSLMFVEEFDPKRKSKARAHAAKEKYRKLRQEIHSKTSAENIVGNRLSIPDRRLPSLIDLGSGFIDPFASYALVLSDDEHRLMYHCKYSQERLSMIWLQQMPPSFPHYSESIGNIMLAISYWQTICSSCTQESQSLYGQCCLRLPVIEQHYVTYHIPLNTKISPFTK